jgi:uncharacterized membrane protein YgdD (TMEM256/DUF423 family)
MTPAPRFVLLGAACGAVAVATGAFAAHALKARLPAESLAWIDTSARYLLAHALLLVATGWVASRWPSRLAVASGWCTFAGCVLFSGSLLLLALTAGRVWAMATPVGGVLLLAGWVLLGAAAWKARH